MFPLWRNLIFKQKLVMWLKFWSSYNIMRGHRRASDYEWLCNNHITKTSSQKLIPLFSFFLRVVKKFTSQTKTYHVLVLLGYNEGRRCASDYEWLCSIFKTNIIMIIKWIAQIKFSNIWVLQKFVKFWFSCDIMRDTGVLQIMNGFAKSSKKSGYVPQLT